MKSNLATSPKILGALTIILGAQRKSLEEIGRKNVEEGREKLSMIKRAGRKSLSRSSEGIIGGIITSVANQKASLDSKPTKMLTVKHNESVDSKIQISDASDTDKMELPTKSSGSQKQMGNKVLVNTSKASLVSVKPSPPEESYLLFSTIIYKHNFNEG